MKQMRLFVMALGAVMAVGTMSVPAAQAAGVSYGADVGMVSKYIWRGVEQSHGAAVQGDVSAAYGGLTASAWFSNSYDSAAAGASNGFPVVETDLTLDYSGSYGKIGYEVGGLYYTYLNDSGDNFPEVYAALSYGGLIVPSIKVSYTPADSNTKYYLAGDTWVDLGLSTVLPGGVSLAGTVSFADWKGNSTVRPAGGTQLQNGKDYWKNGAQLVTVSLSKDYTVSGLTVTPSLTGTIPIVKKSPDGNRYIYNVMVNPEVVVGANISF